MLETMSGVNGRLALAIGVLLIIAVVVTVVRDRYFPLHSEPAATEASDMRSEPTNFAAAGTLRFDDTTGPGQRTPVFEYEGGRKALAMDALSVCAFGNGAVPCMAMSSTYDMSMKDKEAVVEGNALADGTILVRKVRIPAEGDASRMYVPPGDRFISWMHARTLILSCETEMLMQTHALDVYVTLKSGERLRTVEPTIDEVFAVTNEATAACGSIAIGTE